MNCFSFKKNQWTTKILIYTLLIFQINCGTSKSEKRKSEIKKANQETQETLSEAQEKREEAKNKNRENKAQKEEENTKNQNQDAEDKINSDQNSEQEIIDGLDELIEDIQNGKLRPFAVELKEINLVGGFIENKNKLDNRVKLNTLNTPPTSQLSELKNTIKDKISVNKLRNTHTQKFLSELKTEGSFINFGCDPSQYKETSNLIEINPQSMDLNINQLKAQVILVCQGNLLKSQKNHTILSAHTLILSNFTFELKEKETLFLSFNAENTILKGQNSIKVQLTPIEIEGEKKSVKENQTNLFLSTLNLLGNGSLELLLQ